MTKREYEVKDLETIKYILDKSKVVHLGLVDDGMPYVLPMNYGYTMEEGRLTLYLHGAVKGYKIDVMKKNPNCCFEMECDVEPFEGRLPCQYGTSYYSLIGRGMVQLIDDVDKKMEYLSILMKTQTGKDFEFNEKLVSIVSIMKIEATEFTAKHRPEHPTE